MARACSWLGTPSSADATSRPRPISAQIHAVVQDLPDQSTQPVGDSADGLGMTEARDEPTVHDREDCSLGLHRGIGGLVENAPHLAIAFRAAMAVVHTVRAAGSVSPSASACSMRRALMPSRSETMLDSRLWLAVPNHVNELGFANQREMKIWRRALQWRLWLRELRTVASIDVVSILR